MFRRQMMVMMVAMLTLFPLTAYALSLIHI